MAKYRHVLTFLKAIKDAASTTTSDLIVTSDGLTVEDIFDTAQTTGGLVAGIDNDISEIIDKLEVLYKSLGETKLLEKLNKIK